MNTSTSVWKYHYDVSFSQPLNSVVNDKQVPEVKLDAINIRPRTGNFSTLSTSLADKTDGTKKIHIYTVRHGTATHNEQSDIYSKPITQRFLAQLHANFDAKLTEEGVNDSVRAGTALKALIDHEGAPRPVRVYTSPLSRCVQTAMHMIRQLGLDPRHGGLGAELCVRDRLREWKGCRHNHQSDRRGTVSDILDLVARMNAWLGMDVWVNIGSCLPQQPWGVAGETREDELEDVGSETYTDVDIRVRSVLDEIFEVEESGSCVLLVLHNRSNKSLLRALGHSQDEVHKLDVENCAILSYLVKRTRLTDDEIRTRVWHEGDMGESSGQRSNDLAIALAELDQQNRLAAEEVRGLSEEDFQALADYLIGETQKDDTWATYAIIDLWNCRVGLHMQDWT